MVKNNQVVRFGVVGVLNTLIDFGGLFILQSFGLPVGIANIVSTTVAFVFSFFANKKYTFQSSGAHVMREIILFVVVTLFGLWVLQTIIIQLTLPILSGITGRADTGLFFAKLLATCVSLVWNYLLYSRLVFKKH